LDDDDDEPVAVDSSTRAARLDDDMLSAAVCKLRKLSDCCDDSCGDTTELLILAIDSGRCSCSCGRCGSLWRVRMMDSFRRITLPSESKDLTGCCKPEGGGGGGVAPARETDELECVRVGSGESEARERLNGDKPLCATGGCVVGKDCGADDDSGEG
jgi:hypothetical protein